MRNFICIFVVSLPFGVKLHPDLSGYARDLCDELAFDVFEGSFVLAFLIPKNSAHFCSDLLAAENAQSIELSDLQGVTSNLYVDLVQH